MEERVRFSLQDRGPHSTRLHLLPQRLEARAGLSLGPDLQDTPGPGSRLAVTCRAASWKSVASKKGREAGNWPHTPLPGSSWALHVHTSAAEPGNEAPAHSLAGSSLDWPPPS